MTLRLYFTRIKCLCRNYDMLFWSIGFPLLLSIFFYMGFYNLSSGEIIDTITIGVVTKTQGDTGLIHSMKSAKISDKKDMFEVISVSLEEASVLLKDNKIAGYIINEEEPSLYVANNGLSQTIIKSYLDNYIQIRQTASQVMNLNAGLTEDTLTNPLKNYRNFVVDGGIQDKKPNNTVIYFYTLIALTCMYGTNWGFREMQDIQANQSIVGARVNVSPVNKLKLLLCNLMAAFTLHFISVLFLLVFLDKVLRIDFGERIDLILLICLFGSICGISLGAMICVVIKANIKVRSAILNMVVLGGGFLSGMMFVDMKYIIATKAPIIGYINPSSLITDAFYSLYFYEGYERYYINIIILGILSLVFGGITYLDVRRREYASI